MSLPLLNCVNNYFPNVSLEETTIIWVQHILASNAELIKYLIDKKWLNPNKVFLLGKCYSSNIEAITELKHLWVYVDRWSTEFDSHRWFDEQFSDHVSSFIKHIKRQVDTSSQMIILDSGWNIIPRINELNWNKIRWWIEQTTYWYRKLISNNLDSPIINVARSLVKLSQEAQFIASTIANILIWKLKQLWVNSEKILIIWNGAIWKNLYYQIQDKYDCDIIDNLKEWSFWINLEEYDVLVWATWTQVLSFEQVSMTKPGTVLASTSSSDIEFEAVKSRRLLPQSINPHSDCEVNGKVLLNSGFPINFTWVENEDSKDIQLTRALMMWGILSVQKWNLSSWLHDLDSNFQYFINKEFLWMI